MDRVPIKDYEDYYIDRCGNVYNSCGLRLKQYPSNNGYLRVSLCKHQKHKKFLVHRLVAQHFIVNPDNLPQVNHKDYNKQNNKVDNLEWCTCLENLNYSNVIDKASIAKYREVICIDTNEVFENIKSACEKYGLHHSNIVACCNGRRATCGGYKWKYKTSKFTA